jgi:N6-L-threonylcarbamoyladenine synthase
MVGLTTAKALALVAKKPFLAVNHLEAHALSPRLTDGVAFPYLLLLASGGHTQLLVVKGVDDYLRLGTTIDDAIGEAFDKVAKMLGLPYPGGPQVERLAKEGNPLRFAFPRPLMGRKEPNFSLSGLKTAVRIEAEKIAPLSEQDVRDLCASFQKAIVESIIDRTRMAFDRLDELNIPVTALVIAGGVAANRAIRAGLETLALRKKLPLIAPPPALCTDNGAMIAWAGLERFQQGLIDGLDFAPRARWPLSVTTDIRDNQTHV